jgi:ABC-type polysaccharide/polyol phosphate export permease
MIEGLRSASLGRATAVDEHVVGAAVVTVLVLLGGWLFFAQAERRFADVI